MKETIWFFAQVILLGVLVACGGGAGSSRVQVSLNLTIAPTSLNLGSVTVGTTSAAQTVTVTNNSSGSIAVSAITISGPFASTGVTLPVTLNAGQSLTLNVTFTPTASGAATGTLTITSTAGSPTTVTLAGSSPVDINPGMDIPSVVNAQPPGITFVIHPGVYRMQKIVAKDGDVFVGQPGAILNGSGLLTMFSQETINSVTYWVAPGPSQPGQINGVCDSSHPMCMYPEDFFIDNQPLLRVASLVDVTTGACYFDYSSAKIYFLENPNGHTVETSTTHVAFEQGPNNVTIQGLVIEKYANPAQMGAIGDQHPGSGLVVTNSEVRLNHGVGIKVGSSGQVTGNYVHDNGQLGVANDAASGALIENNEIASNNWAGFSVTWASGGIKSDISQNETVRGNYIHDNVGDGLWCDGACLGGLYENNLLINNAKNGIAHEISRAWTMRNNVIIANGFGTATQVMLGAGIIIAESDNVEISRNFIANNYKGVVLNMSPRADCTINGAPFPCDLNNDYVHDNTVVQSTGLAAALYQNVNNDAYYTPAKNNRFVNDQYCLGTSLPGQIYWWLDGYRSQAQWVGYGEDATGTLSCPGVFISSPNNGATISGTVTLSAFAADTVTVSKVELYVDGALVAATTKNYTYPRSTTQAGIGATYSWNTTQVSNGAHTVGAKAYNTAADTSSASVTVTVMNP